MDRVLRTFVDAQGRVDYAGLKARPDDLNAYVALLNRVSPASHPDRFPTRADSLAYWINAYNAFALRGVVEHYPAQSVRDIKTLFGFFSRTDFTAGGRTCTLNHIERDILQKTFQDPRIHAAINCASLGCPRLPRRAFRPQDLDARLEEEMRFFIREPRNVRIDRGAPALGLSEIFKWYEEDFIGWYRRTKGVQAARITDYLSPYLPEEDRAFLKAHPEIKIRYIDYDWGLNDQKAR
ncbi:MAG: DUF547 domain-containing protein [Candidatus Latescibacteria bacterium]|nr:DUF547 domain-containing protein [Candidatus Latescibacterota bacterium]